MLLYSTRRPKQQEKKEKSKKREVDFGHKTWKQVENKLKPKATIMIKEY